MSEALTVRTITFDCAEARSLAQFWAAALGWNVYYDDDPEVLVAPAFPPQRSNGPVLLFIPVPESKAAKNRMHLDLGAATGSRDDQVARLIELGASEVADHRRPDGTGWVVLADPEGNEFCIERSETERVRQTSPKTYRIETA